MCKVDELTKVNLTDEVEEEREICSAVGWRQACRDAELYCGRRKKPSVTEMLSQWWTQTGKTG